MTTPTVMLGDDCCILCGLGPDVPADCGFVKPYNTIPTPTLAATYIDLGGCMCLNGYTLNLPRVNPSFHAFQYEGGVTNVNFPGQEVCDPNAQSPYDGLFADLSCGVHPVTGGLYPGRLFFTYAPVVALNYMAFLSTFAYEFDYGWGLCRVPRNARVISFHLSPLEIIIQGRFTSAEVAGCPPIDGGGNHIADLTWLGCEAKAPPARIIITEVQ